MSMRSNLSWRAKSTSTGSSPATAEVLCAMMGGGVAVNLKAKCLMQCS